MRQFRDMIARKRPLPQIAADTGPVPRPGVATESGPMPAQAAAPVRTEPHEAEDLWPGPQPDPAQSPERAPAMASLPLVEAPAAAPQIWDIDPPDPHDPLPEPVAADPVDPGPADPLRRRRGMAGLPPVAAAPAAAVSRAKTRVLGFAAGEVAADVFAGARAAPAAVARFPAGWIVVVEGPGRGASFTLGAGVSIIGRGADQTVALDFGDMAISREMHASIAYDEEQNRFFVGHGGKSNIVRRNGAPVLATEELFHGDILRIGRTALRFVALCGPDFTWAGEEAQ